MPVRVKCPSCGKEIKAPSKYRGKKVKCPGCKEPLIVPESDLLDEKIMKALAPAAEPPPLPPPPSDSWEKEPATELVIPARPTTIGCPFCSEDIKATAKKCRFCGEFLDDDLRQEKLKESGTYHQSNVHTQQPPMQAFEPQKNTSSNSNSGIAAVLSLVIPGAGQMYKGRVGSGLAWFVATIIGYAMMVIPGLFLHLICVIAAASDD